MHILIAEDDSTSRAILEKICRNSGEHHLTLAADGAEAWTLVDDPKRWFDVVFLDVQMPEMGGLEVLQRIRQSSVYRSIEVVMCTAANDRVTITKAMQLGVRHYIIKPCSEAAVTEKLKLIDQQRVAEAR
ncbi:MAG TPA: response regulator [Lacunisphaera sp.]|nr:response regulator [Lacunisphaera sp.]